MEGHPECWKSSTWSRRESEVEVICRAGQKHRGWFRTLGLPGRPNLDRSPGGQQEGKLVETVGFCRRGRGKVGRKRDREVRSYKSTWRAQGKE